MGHNIRLLADVFDRYKNLNKKGIILTLDFEKAFDSLEWNYLYKVLKFFNFGDTFIKWVNLLYTQPMACIKNNGYMSEKVYISRGIRQGCPVSALLFLLAVETLGIKIRSSPYLRGLCVGTNGKYVKISQYADDGILYLNDKNELCTALSIVTEFGKVAGTILNTSKCEAMFLGKLKNRDYNKTSFGLRWKQNIRFLGIHIGHDQNENYEKSWSKKLNSIKLCIKMVQA